MTKKAVIVRTNVKNKDEKGRGRNIQVDPLSSIHYPELNQEMYEFPLVISEYITGFCV